MSWADSISLAWAVYARLALNFLPVVLPFGAALYLLLRKKKKT